jgi:ribosomal-protein-alanine N-acetyltransferase
MIRFTDFPWVDPGHAGAVLRAIDPSVDAPLYYRYMTDVRLRPFLGDDDIPVSQEAAHYDLQYWAGLFQNRRSVYWGVAERGSDRLIGTAGFNYIDWSQRRAEISYDLEADSWGQGIGSSVVKAITDFAFGELGVVRIQATVAVTNGRSRAVLIKAGFSEEGRLRSYAMVQGTHQDYWMMGRINKERES